MADMVKLGRLVHTPELQIADSGKQFTKNALAVKVIGKDTMFLDIVAFGTTAEIMTKYLKKGNQVLLHLAMSTYKMKHRSTQQECVRFNFIVERVEFVGEVQKNEESVNDGTYDHNADPEGKYKTTEEDDISFEFGD